MRRIMLLMGEKLAISKNVLETSGDRYTKDILQRGQKNHKESRASARLVRVQGFGTVPLKD